MKNPSEVYHGTRCPTDIIKKNGLVYDQSFLLKKTKEFCKRLGVNFEAWSHAKAPYPSGLMILNRMLGQDGSKYRTRIWVTEKFDNAVSYATRNPEILYDVIRSIMHFKHPRKRSDKWYREIDNTVVKFLREIGSPKVVVIDNRYIGARGVNNPMKGVGVIPPEVIIRIIETDEKD